MSRQVLVASALGAVLVAGVVGAALIDDDSTSGPAAAGSTPSATVAPPPTSLERYAMAADAVCDAAFEASPPVDVRRTELAQVLADRVITARLEVQTAERLLALDRPEDVRAQRAGGALVGHRDAYAGVLAAAQDDGRSVQERSEAVVQAEPKTAPASRISATVFLRLGAQRCAAWLDPSLLQDSAAN